MSRRKYVRTRGRLSVIDGKPKPYQGPAWIGEAITPPPLAVGRHWIGKRVSYRERKQGAPEQYPS